MYIIRRGNKANYLHLMLTHQHLFVCMIIYLVKVFTLMDPQSSEVDYRNGLMT